MELVPALLDSGATAHCLNNEQLAPIHLAVAGDHTNILKILLEHDRDLINCVSPATGLNPLHMAAIMGHKECAEMLLRYGASVTQLTGEKYGSPENRTSVLHLAALQHAKQLGTVYVQNLRPEKRRTFLILDLLINYLPSEQVDFGSHLEYESILHSFATINYAAGIRKLTGAPYNLPPDELNGAGYSPLLMALKHRSLEAVEALVEHNVDVTRYEPELQKTATELLILTMAEDRDYKERAGISLFQCVLLCTVNAVYQGPLWCN